MAAVGSELWRRNVSEGTRRGKAARRRREAARQAEERERARVCPRDLERLERSGVVAPALVPLLGIAFEESRDLTAQLGGPDEVTPAQRIVIEDLAAVGIALRACLVLFAQGPDPEIASRLATLAGARRSSLALLGLQHVAKDVAPDLASYLRSRGNGAANGANGSAPDPEAGAVVEVSPTGQESHETAAREGLREMPESVYDGPAEEL